MTVFPNWLKSLGVITLCLLAAGFGAYVYKSQQADAYTLDGKRVRWEAHHGQVVVINFFAKWCAPCLREMPQLNQFHHQYGQQVPIYTVSYDVLSVEELQGLATTHQIEVPMIINDERMHLPVPVPPMLPATYFLGPDGNVMQTLYGEQTLDTLREATGV